MLRSLSEMILVLQSSHNRFPFHLSFFLAQPIVSRSYLEQMPMGSLIQWGVMDVGTSTVIKTLDVRCPSGANGFLGRLCYQKSTPCLISVIFVLHFEDGNSTGKLRIVFFDRYV